MYIGNSPNNQAYTPAVDFFSGNASTTAFTLSRPVASTYQMLVVVANVTQNPGSAYTVSGNTITFASAPPSGTNNIWVQYTSLLVQVIVPTNSYQVTGPVYTGTSAPLGGATNPITGSTGSANNYIQTYIYNTFNGANSSADFTAYASNGTDASGWADMGITSPSFSQAAYSVTGPGEPYLFGSAVAGAGASGNLVIATDSTGSSNAIQFYTGGFNQAKSAARMTIDGSGNVLVGTTSATSSAKVCVSASMNSYNGIVMVDTGSTGGNYMQFLNSSPAQAGAITHFGTTTVLYTTSSDYRLKENIAPMTGALAKVAQLKPCTYTWKDGGAVGDGFIAHELQTVFPDAVAGEKDAVNEDGTPKYQGIDTSVLVATLTAAIQEQQAIITQLQADIAALKAKVGA